jgi:hypothetical protein
MQAREAGSLDKDRRPQPIGFACAALRSRSISVAYLCRNATDVSLAGVATGVPKRLSVRAASIIARKVGSNDGHGGPKADSGRCCKTPDKERSAGV